MLERVGSYVLNENFCYGYNLARDGTGTVCSDGTGYSPHCNVSIL